MQGFGEHGHLLLLWRTRAHCHLLLENKGTLPLTFREKGSISFKTYFVFDVLLEHLKINRKLLLGKKGTLYVLFSGTS